MLKIKCFSLLLILILLLLLFISCDLGIKARTNTRAELRTKAEEIVGDEEELAYLDDISDPKLKALLDQFGVSGAGRKAVIYIRGGLLGDDVYDRLNKLGADVVIEKIIKPTVSLLKARGEALRVIQDPTNEGVKVRLQDVFHRYDNLVDIRGKFIYVVGSEDNFAKAVTRYASKFSKFKEMVKNPRVMDVYAWLDDADQATIDEIENIVISDTYDKDKFNSMLNSLDDYRIVRIIDIYRDIKIKQEEALKAIEGVSDDAEKQNLKTRLERLQGEYNSHIRDAFNKSEGELSFQLTNDSNKYRRGFDVIKSNAKAVKASGAAGGGS
ncbi:BTA121 domain-containing protein surface lipoprotein [Borrelia turicatae]|uniref:Lipoprotein n=1 Tax=Borrelia turicatae (strain 91E135) TaxID=314724 RepID=T1ECS0_BORT9|nr:DUF1617 family protein [Borrelia turicatae]ADN26546.2 hypothetical protein BTA116 [Borrelia turicatae 91E135]UPA14040.1 DUF1617 family protein [Borrelia turicatae 91E135]